MIRETALGLSLTMIPLALGVIPAKWLLQARPGIREPIAQANALLELGRRAPENGARAFEKAFDLYSSALAESPQNFAATYGCGLALYELARITQVPAGDDLISRALHWFGLALDLEPKPELRRLVTEIEEYRASLRGA